MVRDHDIHRAASDVAVEMKRMEKLIARAREAERAAERERLLGVFGVELGPDDVATPGRW